MRKKDILIACQPLDTGGVTRSLLSLLHSIDYDRYNVDLVLMRCGGEFLNMLPEKVNLLEPALDERNKCLSRLYKLFIYTVKGYLPYRPFYRMTRGKRYKNGDFQLMAGHARCAAARRIKKRYDAAVGYMEGFDNYFITKKVNAGRKIGYIHVDYENAGLDGMLDIKCFEKLDNIVLVSEENKRIFDRLFPQFSDKTTVVENIVRGDIIRKQAEEEINDFEPDPKVLNIVTASRLVIKHKGLDRAVAALGRLVKEGYAVKWYVFGEGPDRGILEKMTEEYKLENSFYLMGNRKNVYPYIKKCDLFVLPSRYEGKPLAVAEAQVLGIVPVVTEYMSAREQIKDGFDGLILENNDKSVYYGIKRLADDRELLCKLRNNLKNKELDYLSGLSQFYALLEGRENRS